MAFDIDNVHFVQHTNGSSGHAGTHVIYTYEDTGEYLANINNTYFNTTPTASKCFKTGDLIYVTALDDEALFLVTANYNTGETINVIQITDLF